MSDPVKKLFFDTIRHGRAFEVSPLLRDHPDLNVNYSNSDESTPLQAASLFDSVEIVKLLLAHPNIDVNLKDIFGRPPISYGCYGGFVSIVRLFWRILVSMSHWMTTMAALHCGGHPVMGALKWLRGSLQVAEIWEMSRTRKGKTGKMAKATQPLKLQERRRRVKLCHCLKDSSPIQHRRGKK